MNEPNFDGMPFGLHEIRTMWVETPDDGLRQVVVSNDSTAPDRKYHAVVRGITHDEAGAIKRKVWGLVRVAQRLING